MRFIVLFLTFLTIGNTCFADTSSHETAAKKLQVVIFAIDKPKLLQALSASLGGQSAYNQAVVLEAFDGTEFEQIYIKSLMKTFSESELIAINEIMTSQAYRTYMERMPNFFQTLMPEVTAYWSKGLPEFKRRATEKLKNQQK